MLCIQISSWNHFAIFRVTQYTTIIRNKSIGYCWIHYWRQWSVHPSLWNKNMQWLIKDQNTMQNVASYYQTQFSHQNHKPLCTLSYLLPSVPVWSFKYPPKKSHCYLFPTLIHPFIPKLRFSRLHLFLNFTFHIFMNSYWAV